MAGIMDMKAVDIGGLAGHGGGHTLRQMADPGELAQHIKSQLLSGDKVLNKNQRKKARKKVTKLLHKTLGVPRPPTDTLRGAAGALPTLSEDTGCSNRCMPGVRADPPACTSSPQPGPCRAARPPQPPPSLLPEAGTQATVVLGGGNGSRGAKAGAVEAAGCSPHQEPLPKRRRLHPDTRAPSSGDAQMTRCLGPANGSSQPLPLSGSRDGGGGGGGGKAGASQGWRDNQPKAHAFPIPNPKSSSAPRAGPASRSTDGLTVGIGLSGGNSSQQQMSRGEQKRLSRRQAQPEDLLTADNGSDGDGRTGGGAGSLYGSGLYDSAGRGQGGAGGGRVSKGGDDGQEEGGAGAHGRRRDRRERNRRQQRLGKRRKGGADGGGGDTSIAAAASEEIVQVLRPTGTVASAAAAAAAVAVHRTAPYLMHRTSVFSATLVAAAAAGPLRPMLAMAARSADCTTAGQGQMDLSAALLLMRVQARATERVHPGASVEPSCTTLTGTEGDGAVGAAAGASAMERATGSGMTDAIAGSLGVDAVQTTNDPNQGTALPTAVTAAAAASGAIAVRIGAGGHAEGDAGVSVSPGAKRLGRQQQQQQQQPGCAAGTAPAAEAGSGAQKRSAAAGQQLAPAARATLYRYGNYQRYYGYRLGPDLDEDPRVKLMRREWFQNKVCFDIGCNEGLVTLAVAARFGAKRMTGYDIDASLIKRACRNLRIMRSEYTSRLQALTLGSSAPVSTAASWGDDGGWDSPQHQDQQQQQHPDQEEHGEQLSRGEDEGEFDRGANVIGEEEEDEDEGREEEIMVVVEEEGLEKGWAGPKDAEGGEVADGDDDAAAAGAVRSSSQQHGTRPRSQPPPPRVPYLTAKPPPPRVGLLRSYVRSLAGSHFVQQDWANARGRPESADTILCLSVTKWVHLNNGDEGLKRMFKKFFDTLTPGGLLVLEPQPWKSYKRAVSKTTTNAVPFKRIEQLQLRPQHFIDYLTSSQVGFLLEARLNEGGAAGFDRPVFLLRKPAPGSAEGGATGTTRTAAAAQ